MTALDAVVEAKGPRGERSIPIAEFFRLPGDTPQLNTNLQAGELIIAVNLPKLDVARKSTYIKVRDRNSCAFALVSVAAMIDLDANGYIFCQALRNKLMQTAIADSRSALHGAAANDVTIEDGKIFTRANPSRGEPIAAVVRRVAVHRGAGGSQAW